MPEGEWFDYGHDAIWVVDYTEGGAPYGPTRTQMKDFIQREGAGAAWARAKAVLHDAFHEVAPPNARIEIGRVTKIGEGLSREAYAAYVDVSPDPDRLSGAYAAFLPKRDAEGGLDQRTEREMRLLHKLAKHELPFRVARVLGAWRDGRHLALVRTAFDGIPLDLRSGRQPSVRPWEIVGEIAAALHSLDVTPFVDVLGGEASRKEHALAALRVFHGLDVPEARDAVAWAREHLPPDEPSSFLHGDLLGQNILLWPGEPPALIDWEYARRGDPAYDLAIVTRGKRQPFQIAGGMDRLLDAYRCAGGPPVDVRHVRLYELCMLATWYRESLQPQSTHPAPPDQALAHLRNLLGRVK